MHDKNLVAQLVDSAYNDVIATRKWHYQGFIDRFDKVLEDFVHLPALTRADKFKVYFTINKDSFRRNFRNGLRLLFNRSFPGRRYIKHLSYIFMSKGANF